MSYLLVAHIHKPHGKRKMQGGSVHGVSPTALVYQSSAFPAHVVLPFPNAGLTQTLSISVRVSTMPRVRNTMYMT